MPLRQGLTELLEADFDLRIGISPPTFSESMTKITDTLAAEHAVFCGLFDFIELTQARLRQLTPKSLSRMKKL